MNRKNAASIKIRSKFTYTYDHYLQAIENRLNIIEIPIKGVNTRKSHLLKNVFGYSVKAFYDILVNFSRKSALK